MDNEKYGIELELITSKFDEKMQKVKNSFSALGNEKINLNTNSAQLEYLKQQIKEISALLDYNAKKPFMDYNDVLKNRVQLEKLTNQYNKLIAKQNEVNVVQGKVHVNMTKGFDKMTSKIKRFGLSLLGIRTIWALVSRAGSAYMAQDTALSNKLQATWAGLGAMLAPIIERIVDILAKAVKYINIFIKALTGVDLLAKATAKSMNNTTKSAKGLSKALAGFDELTNLDTATETPSIDTSPFDAFKDVEINTEWADRIEKFGEWIKKNWKPIAIGIGVVVGALLGFKVIKTIINLFKGSKTVTDALTNWSGVFKGFFDKLGTAVEIIAILGGLSLVIKEITGLIESFSESGLTLGEVAGLLGIVLGELAIAFVAIAGASKLMDWQGIAGATVILGGFAIIINQVSNLLETFSRTGMKVSDVVGLMAAIFIPIVALMGAVALIGPAMTAGLLPFLAVVAGISVILLVMKETLPTILEACGTFVNSVAPSIKSILETIGNLITNIIYALGDTLPPIIDSVGRVFDKIFNGIAKVVKSVGNVVNGILEGIRKIIKQIGDTIEQVAKTIIWFINELGPAINNFVDNTIRAITKLVNFVVSAIEYLVNTIIGGVNNIINTINSVGEYVGITIPTIPKVYIPRFVPQLATGTNYVPKDQLAMIHKGEAVVPKKFNSREYFGGSNDETNAKLDRVIEAIENIEINPYTTIRDVGKASLNYINSKSRQLGESVVV